MCTKLSSFLNKRYFKGTLPHENGNGNGNGNHKSIYFIGLLPTLTN